MAVGGGEGCSGGLLQKLGGEQREGSWLLEAGVTVEAGRWASPEAGVGGGTWFSVTRKPVADRFSHSTSCPAHCHGKQLVWPPLAYETLLGCKRPVSLPPLPTSISHTGP